MCKRSMTQKSPPLFASKVLYLTFSVLHMKKGSEVNVLMCIYRKYTRTILTKLTYM